MNSEEQLELERNRVVVQLAGAVAHKLKQPLAVAWGYLELLFDDPRVELDPTTVRYLREIQASLRTMDDVIGKLQQATVHQTRPYAGAQEILDLDVEPVVNTAADGRAESPTGESATGLTGGAGTACATHPAGCPVPPSAR